MKTRNLALALVAAVAAGAVAGGVAWATIPGDGGVIQGCYTKVGGILRVIDTAKGERCFGIELPITWNQKGPKGDPGATGASGAPGVSPTVAQLQPGDPTCPAGGAAITAADGSTANVCNGTNGQSFAGTVTSPNGQYSIGVTDAGITLSNGQGTSLALTGNDLTLRSAGDFDLVSDHSIGLTAGTSATVLAGSTFTLKGSGAGLVQSSGVLSLKGSAVNVN
jgi:hypothetical protein